MKYYKDQHTIVEEEEIELGTDYGNYMVVIAVETMIFSDRISRKKYITIYETEEEEEEKGFWGKVRQLFQSNYPILPRTLVPEEIKIGDAINDWIIDWELPKHEIAQAIQGGKNLKINYAKELERRTKDAQIKAYRYEEPTIESWNSGDDMDRTFIQPHYKRGMHPNSQAKLKQNRETG